MKKHIGGLAKFLNDDTQNATRNLADNAHRIVYIDIDNIVSNPRNFYGLRDIDSLAGLIAVSRMVEPLIVCPEEDGKYMLLSGHRRRAAVQKLLEDGDYDERKLPCIIHERRKITIPQENGEEIVFDESDVDLLHLIASNRGQRKERTMDEKLSEVKYLEPFARAVFAQKKREQGRGMVFRKFFAEEILDISSSKLQRLESIEKLSPRVKAAVESGSLKETNAVRLAGFSMEEQDKILDWLEEKGCKGTMQDVENAIQAILSENNPAEDGSDQDAAVPSGMDADDEKVNGEDGGEVAENNDHGNSNDDGNEPDINHPEEEVDTEPSSEPASHQETGELPTEKDNSAVSQEKATQLMDIPDAFDNPQEEAEDWFLQERLSFYQSVETQAKHLSETETNERKAAQWGIRASVARYHIAELLEKQQARSQKYA